jgi:hypothetical protein
MQFRVFLIASLALAVSPMSIAKERANANRCNAEPSRPPPSKLGTVEIAAGSNASFKRGEMVRYSMRITQQIDNPPEAFNPLVKRVAVDATFICDMSVAVPPDAPDDFVRPSKSRLGGFRAFNAEGNLEKLTKQQRTPVMATFQEIIETNRLDKHCSVKTVETECRVGKE